MYLAVIVFENGPHFPFYAAKLQHGVVLVITLGPMAQMLKNTENAVFFQMVASFPPKSERSKRLKIPQ
jgi:hypothetical protein